MGDLHGAVTTTAVADHDFVGDADDRRQVSSERFFFVECGDDNGDSCAGQIGGMLA